jgi:hypothetical protein
MRDLLIAQKLFLLLYHAQSRGGGGPSGFTRYGIAQKAPNQAAHDDIWKEAIKFRLGGNAFNLDKVLESLARQDSN